MSKYTENRGIVVKTPEQVVILKRVLLKSQEQKSVSPHPTTIGDYDPSLWNLKKSL